MDKTRRAFSKALMILPLMAVAACASQTEMARLRQEVVDLQKQLEVEKQRQAANQEKLKRARQQDGQASSRP